MRGSSWEQFYPYYAILLLTLFIGFAVQLKAGQRAPERVCKRLRGVRLFDVTEAFPNHRNDEVYHYIKGSGRALAVKEGLGEAFDKLDNAKRDALMKKHGCLIFTSLRRDEGKGVRPEEMAKVDSLMKSNGEGRTFVAIGEPDRIEDALGEFLSASI